MCKLIFYFLFIFILLAQQVVKASDVTPGYKLGVYYFPGWMEGARGGAVNPWERIQKYPDREPLLGWYRDGDVEVAERHIQWMHDYGIDYVVYDWYTDGTPFLEHALSAYFKAKNRDLIKFSILWANHSHFPDNLDQFESMVRYWVKYYFKSDQYMKIDQLTVSMHSQLTITNEDSLEHISRIKENLIAMRNLIRHIKRVGPGYF